MKKSSAKVTFCRPMIDNGMVSLCTLCCRVAMLGIVFGHSRHDDADVVVCLNITVLLLCCLSHVAVIWSMMVRASPMSFVCLYAVVTLSLYFFVFS